MQTWVATKIIQEIGLEDRNHPLISGILQYLSINNEFDGHRWHGLNTVRSNNDFPHAPWWSYVDEEETSYNPTASLIGFILKYADENTSLYRLACKPPIIPTDGTQSMFAKALNSSVVPKVIFILAMKEFANLNVILLKKPKCRWNVTWQWDAFDEQWSISKNWWKSELIIRNHLYLQSLDVKA